MRARTEYKRTAARVKRLLSKQRPRRDRRWSWGTWRRRNWKK